MATEIAGSEEVVLQDGTKLTIRPLNIKSLKKFMQVIEKMQEVEEDEFAAIDLMIEAAAIPIGRENKELAEDRERLEEVLDVPLIHKILEVAGGVEMDPNPTGTALPGRT